MLRVRQLRGKGYVAKTPWSQPLPDHLGQFGEDSVAIALVLDAELRLTGHEIEVKVDLGLILSEENLGSVPVSRTAAETASRRADGRVREMQYRMLACPVWRPKD